MNYNAVQEMPKKNVRQRLEVQEMLREVIIC